MALYWLKNNGAFFPGSCDDVFCCLFSRFCCLTKKSSDDGVEMLIGRKLMTYIFLFFASALIPVSLSLPSLISLRLISIATLVFVVGIAVGMWQFHNTQMGFCDRGDWRVSMARGAAIATVISFASLITACFGL